MPDLTHDHLNAVADRLEASYRRECDHMRAEIKEDLGDLREVIQQQNGRIGKSEAAIAELRENTRVLTHDFTNHLNFHSVSSVTSGTVRPPLTAGFTAGVTSTVLILAGAGNAAWDWLVTYLPGIVKAWQKP